MFPHLIACVESQHADAAAIRQLPGLGALDDPDLRVSEATAEAAWQLATALTRDEAIGVHVAESLPRGGLDLVEYAFRSSPSVRAGLERLAHYGSVLSDRAAVRMEANGGDLLLIVRDVGTSHLHPGRAEFALAVALKLARDGAGVDLAPLRVSFGHDRPADTSEHQRFFRCPVQFAAGSNAMVLSATDAARSLQGADDALSVVVRRRLDKFLRIGRARSPHRSAPESGACSSRISVRTP